MTAPLGWTAPRPPEVADRVAALAELTGRDPKQARERLRALEAEPGADDVDLVRARAMLDFLET